MSVPQPRLLYSIDEYLVMEREAVERHEYLDGAVWAMAGESLAHSTICTNLIGELHFQLKGKPCTVLSPNMKIRSGPYIQGQRTAKGMFSYADLTVVCGTPLFHDQHQDVLLNPVVIFEVLSPGTEAFDRGEKFQRYRAQIESLTDYVLVAQNIPVIEHFRRQADGQWLMGTAYGLDRELPLASIECHLKLADVYNRVEFPSDEAEVPAET